MSPRAGDVRSRGVADALTRHLETGTPEGRVLVLGDPEPAAADLLSVGQADVTRWSRVVSPGARVSPWPPEGPWDTVALRLPRAKEELEMLLHAALSVLVPGGILLVYGANDEGIRSAPSVMEPLVGRVETTSVKSRCRVLRAVRPSRVPGLRDDLEEWRTSWTLELDELRCSWASYPGVFSHGRMDPGTRLLLETAAPPAEGARVLDYGCGIGVLGGVLAERAGKVALHLLDADAVALHAAARNVPGARTVLADGLHAVAAEEPFDLVVSNPPYHRGKAEDRGVVEALIGESPRVLTRSGALLLVVQRRFDPGPALKEGFGRVEIRGEDRTYRVWRAEGPRRGRVSSPSRGRRRHRRGRG